MTTPEAMPQSGRSTFADNSGDLRWALCGARMLDPPGQRLESSLFPKGEALRKPTDEELIAAGGWDFRYARVLARAFVGPENAMVLIDTNGAQGDRPYEYVESLSRWAEGWRSSGSSAGSGGGCGWESGIAYAYGHAKGPCVTVEFRGVRHVVPVQSDGWWVFAEDAPDFDYGLHPRRVE